MATRYEEIVNDLRAQIASGALAPGDQLPPEAALSKRYKTGLPTLRRALDKLKDDGLLEKRHGRGNFVLGTRPRVTYANDRPIAGEKPDDTEFTYISVREVPADAALASTIGVPTGSKVVECTVVARQEQGPAYSLVRSYVAGSTDAGSTDLAPVIASSRSPWGDDFRERLTAAGVELDRTVERVMARPATTQEAEKLDISAGTPVLAIQRRSIDTAGRTVEAATLVLPSDRAEAVYTTSERSEL